MGEGEWGISAFASQCDPERSIVENRDRPDQAADFRSQLLSAATHAPVRHHIGGRYRCAGREPGLVAQCHDPCTAVSLEPPGGRQSWPHTSVTVNSDEGLVQLPEKQSLALVRWMWCIGWIDSFPEPHGGHGFTCFRNQPAVDGAFSRKPCCWRWRRRRNIYGFRWSGCRLRKWHSMRRGTENTSPDRRKADDVREPDTVPVPHLHRLTHPHYSRPQRNRNRITKTTLLKFGRVTAPSNKYCASYL